MATLRIGYVDVRVGLTSLAKPTLKTFPLDVLLSLGTSMLDDAVPASTGLAWAAQNAFQVTPPPGVDLLVGAAVTQAGGGGQGLEVGIVPLATLVDAEVTVRINTSVSTDNTDYGIDKTDDGIDNPDGPAKSPKRGESFIVTGVRSILGGPVPAVGFRVGIANGTATVAPRDVTSIGIKGRFAQPSRIVVGQWKQRTAEATDSLGGDYRRALGTDGDGLLLDAQLHDPAGTTDRWVHVDITQPRSSDAPPQPIVPVPEPVGGGTGAIPRSGVRTYQVSWVHGTWTGNTATGHVESSVSPPSTPTAAPSGAVKVPLPGWTDPKAPVLVPGAPPEPPVAWRIYRTVTAFAKAGQPVEPGGDAYLVAEVPATKPADPTKPVVPPKTWTDTVADADLTTPLLSELKVDFRHTSDSKGQQRRDGFASLVGVLRQSSYEEDAAGKAQYRGQRIGIDLSSTPGSVVVGYTTRPTGDQPRVTWSSSSPSGPVGVGAAHVTLDPTGVAIGDDQSFDVGLESVPAAFGVRWGQRGPDRLRVEVGSVADAGKPLDVGVGLVSGRARVGDAIRKTPSARSVEVDLTADDLTFTARRLRRLRLLLGLAPPGGGGFAVDGDGVVAEVELDSRPADQRRSLRVRRETSSASGTSRLVARVGDLPDAVTVDVRPANPFPDDGSAVVPLQGRLTGRLRRVAVLNQTTEDVAQPAPADGRRRDGVNVTIRDTGERVDFSVDARQVVVTPTNGLRVGASVRSSTGLGTTSPVHQVQATVSTSKELTVGLPQDDGSLSATAGGGFSGRVAMSTRGVDGTNPDRLSAVRATPQAVIRLRRVEHPPDPKVKGAVPVEKRLLDDLTVRWLGATGFNKPADVVGPHYRAGFTPTRTNKAVRTRIWMTDSRTKPDTWEMVRARVADVPEFVRATADTGKDHYSFDFNRRAGQTVLFARPPIVPTDGLRAGQLVGVGLAEAVIDSLPPGLQVDLLGSKNDQRPHPFISIPPADWRRSGFRIEAEGELVIRSLNVLGVSYVRPRTYDGGLNGLPGAGDFVPPTAFWKWTAASLIRIHSDTAEAPGAVWIWTPAGPLPHLPSSDYTEEDEWEDLPTWLGFRVESPALVDLQVQPYEAHTATIPTGWDDAALGWLLKAEFQMKDYRGEVTMQDDLLPEGDTDSGPGTWTVRVPDGIPKIKGQIVFGNTGGTPSNRPRIYPVFVPKPTQQPTF